MDNLKEINCKEIFKKAYENRYTWKNDFHGYQGKCIFLTNNNTHVGDFILGKDFKPNIQKNTFTLVTMKIIFPGVTIFISIFENLLAIDFF